MKTKLSTAYEAFWFLSEHPKLKCKEATLISEKDAKKVKLSKGERIRKVKDQMPWVKDTYTLREFALEREAFPQNLDIHYAKVDQRGRVNNDASKNVHVECWVEFGDSEQCVSEGRLHLQRFHDIRLDCGAPTFDEALVKLARLVRRHYGDYRRTQDGASR